jgi:quercetin dioxygenase-like cupin family protein
MEECAMAEATRTREYRDDRNLGEAGADDVTTRQKLTTPSWQVASIPANAKPKVGGGSYIGLSHNKRASVALNVYTPRKRDEMHCHPGSEHIFLVWQGQLTIRGINESEEITLNPGEFVHIKAGHYYQLCNDTDDITVLYQVATEPVKPSPVGRRSFRRAGELRPEDINDRGLAPA